jgi:hypothetical protein
LKNSDLGFGLFNFLGNESPSYGNSGFLRLDWKKFKKVLNLPP